MFKIEQRSKGFQWFLSFYLRLNAERSETNIILIDEPGLYLHAKAQKDVLKVLEQIAKESKVIFSTHSSYLVDPNRLDRVRLVLNEPQYGTRIENKIHKNADTETLTPIITAIGLDLTHDFSLAKGQNVLLEGISDYYYLQALNYYLPKTEKIQVNFIPCVGATKIPQLASLLIGWDLDFAAVLDKDKEGKRVVKQLIEKLTLQSDKVIFVSENDNFSIEDVFTREDFNNFVLQDIKNKNEDLLMSEFVKRQNNKVLLAKSFFDRVQNDKPIVNLSSNTINAFKLLFDKILQAFGKESLISPTSPPIPVSDTKSIKQKATREEIVQKPK